MAGFLLPVFAVLSTLAEKAGEKKPARRPVFLK
jgi:hypothetical protein